MTFGAGNWTLSVISKCRRYQFESRDLGLQTREQGLQLSCVVHTLWCLCCVSLHAAYCLGDGIL